MTVHFKPFNLGLFLMHTPDQRDVEELKRKTPQELALFLLRLASQQLSIGMFHPKQIKDDKGLLTGVPLNPLPPDPDPPMPNALTVEIAEAWNWATLNGMLMDAPGDNAVNGWKMLTKKGIEAVEKYRKEAEEPKGLAKEPLGPRAAPPRAGEKL